MDVRQNSDGTWTVEIHTYDSNYYVEGKYKEDALEKAVKSVSKDLSRLEKKLGKIYDEVTKD